MEKVVYLIPHQDDEALTFGASIVRHLEVGHDVHVVLYTDGISSYARKVLNGSIYCAWHKKIHENSAEGYCLVEDADFTKYRDGEFRRSLKALGVPNSNIHISRFVMKDGDSDVNRCKTVMREVVNLLGKDVSINTFSDLAEKVNSNIDHVNMGKAARNFYESAYIKDLRMFVEPYLLDDFKAAYPGVIVESDNATNLNPVKNAIGEYKKWNPAEEQFGIGYHSVPESIDDAIANPNSYYHIP